MVDKNKRYIDIEGTNTRVGYNFLKQQYYVTNTDVNSIPYTTYRNTIEDIREVLKALNITETTNPELFPPSENLENLETLVENLYKVSYTVQDSGAYVHTLQFNDFKENPLTLDCEKQKLYIMNSTIVYDLNVNESPRNVRIPRILNFYREKLGLLISTDDMRYFYSLLLSYYNPTCYNQIEYNESTGKYFYNNKFILSNYNKKSNATYICTYNPNNSAPLTEIANVSQTSTTTNTIQVVENPFPIPSLQGYNKVIVKGADTYIEETDTEYSADGEYTISSIEESTLKVEETMPYAYSFPYKECYLLGASYSIASMNRTKRTITLTNLPNNVLVGDMILVTGAIVETPHETISCNGTYTVEAIQDKTIIVEEEIPTDFTSTPTVQANLLKEIFLSNISSIASNTITLITPVEETLTNSSFLIHTINNGETSIENIKGTTTSNNIIQITEGTLEDYTPNYPKLCIPIPNKEVNAEVLIDITYVSENAQGLLPLGEFLVDSFEECKNYLGILAGLKLPSELNKRNLYEELPQEVPLDTIPDLTTSFDGDTISCTIPSMKLLGLYTQIYSDEG